MDSPRLNRARCCRALLMVGTASVLFVTPGIALSQSAPATQAVDTTPRPQDKVIGRLLDELANPSELVRDDARRQLMGLKRPDLPSLQRVLRSRGDLLPSQATSLYDIVAQIYASGDTYPQFPQGFLGLWWDMFAPVDAETHVTVAHRVLGFCGYRMLEDGDVLISITQPEGEAVPIRSVEDVRVNVSACKPGDVVTFELLRQGKVIRVPVPLDGRPSEINTPADLQQIRAQRERAAEEYWDKEFAPLVRGNIS